MRRRLHPVGAFTGRISQMARSLRHERAIFRTRGVAVRFSRTVTLTAAGAFLAEPSRELLQ